jgi:hypothetical protein
MFCGAAIPSLLIWACVTWQKRLRGDLPHWRNGLGLASFTLIFAAWAVEFLELILALNRVEWRGFQNFSTDWLYVQIYIVLAAPFLALALKGLPRIQVFTAGILLYVFGASLVYGYPRALQPPSLV